MPFDKIKKEERTGLREKQELAREGSRGPSESLPHRQTLESAFGQSLGDVKVHRGPDAKLASSALNAEGYAHRGSIALGPSADLKVVAEEVAHILQQRSGGQSGPGRVTSPYGPAEREASEAANAVVSGSVVGPMRQGLSGESIARRKKKPPVVGSPGKGLLEKKMPPRELGSVEKSLHKHADQLTPKEKSAHIHSQHHLYKGKMKKGAKLSRIIKRRELESQLSGKWAPQSKGYFGYDDVTRDLSAQEKISTRGLDYPDSEHVKGDKKKEPIDETFNYLFGASEQNIKDLKVPLAPEMLKHRDQHMKGDPESKFPTTKEDLEKDDDGKVDHSNPFRGYGGAQPGPRMDQKYRKSRINQELKADDLTPLPIGTQIEHTKGKKKQTIARLLPGRNKKGHFQSPKDKKDEQGNVVKKGVPPKWNLGKKLSKKDHKRFGGMMGLKPKPRKKKGQKKR